MGAFTFASLIAPVTTDEFFKDYWEKKLLHLKRNQENYFDSILNITDIDLLFSHHDISHEHIKLVSKGQFIPADEWTKYSITSFNTKISSIDLEVVNHLFQNGATIIIFNAEKLIPSLARAFGNLAQELNIRFDAYVYVTPPKAQGFLRHYDSHDIFLMQIKGPKTWRIYDSGEELPTSSAAFTKEPKLVTELEVNSGDVVYIPRGTVHEAFSSEGSAIHVNFSLDARYGFHMLEWLIEEAEKQELFFRRSIPHGFSSAEEKKEYAEMFTKKLADLIQRTTPDILLRREEEHFVKKQLIDFQGLLKDSIALVGLNLDSVLTRRKGCSVLLSKDEKGTLVSFGEKGVVIPVFVEKALLLQDAPFHVKEIKGLLTDDGRIQLAKELVKSGFLQIESI